MVQESLILLGTLIKKAPWLSSFVKQLGHLVVGPLISIIIIIRIGSSDKK